VILKPQSKARACDDALQWVWVASAWHQLSRLPTMKSIAAEHDHRQCTRGCRSLQTGTLLALFVYQALESPLSARACFYTFVFSFCSLLSLAVARTTPSAIGLRANADSYSYSLASLTVPSNLGVLANDNYTESCAGNTARATLLSVPVRGSVALDTDGGFVYTVTNSTPPGTSLCSHFPAISKLLSGVGSATTACLSTSFDMTCTPPQKEGGEVWPALYKHLDVP
jgi:hypothetical protein